MFLFFYVLGTDCLVLDYYPDRAVRLSHTNTSLTITITKYHLPSYCYQTSLPTLYYIIHYYQMTSYTDVLNCENTTVHCKKQVSLYNEGLTFRGVLLTLLMKFGLCLHNYFYCQLLLLSTHSLDPCLWGEFDHPAFGLPASFSLHLASSSITPAGSVHKSRGDSVVHMWVQLKRWCVS